MSEFAARWLFGNGTPEGVPFAGGAALGEQSSGPPAFLTRRAAAGVPAERRARTVSRAPAPRGRVHEERPLRLSATPPTRPEQPSAPVSEPEPDVEPAVEALEPSVDAPLSNEAATESAAAEQGTPVPRAPTPLRRRPLATPPASSSRPAPVALRRVVRAPAVVAPTPQAHAEADVPSRGLLRRAADRLLGGRSSQPVAGKDQAPASAGVPAAPALARSPARVQPVESPPGASPGTPPRAAAANAPPRADEQATPAEAAEQRPLRPAGPAPGEPAEVGGVPADATSPAVAMDDALDSEASRAGAELQPSGPLLPPPGSESPGSESPGSELLGFGPAGSESPGSESPGPGLTGSEPPAATTGARAREPAAPPSSGLRRALARLRSTAAPGRASADRHMPQRAVDRVADARAGALDSAADGQPAAAGSARPAPAPAQAAGASRGSPQAMGGERRSMATPAVARATVHRAPSGLPSAFVPAGAAVPPPASAGEGGGDAQVIAHAAAAAPGPRKLAGEDALAAGAARPPSQHAARPPVRLRRLPARTFSAPSSSAARLGRASVPVSGPQPGARTSGERLAGATGAELHRDLGTGVETIEFPVPSGGDSVSGAPSLERVLARAPAGGGPEGGAPGGAAAPAGEAPAGEAAAPGAAPAHEGGGGASASGGGASETGGGS
ncbi:MAG TPA: hypothetical protein VNV37_11895, partial [Solirubrobacteraceae bacterium]|nr:hypothetical protein [Solirubrobacteraceae bacterium]